MALLCIYKVMTAESIAPSVLRPALRRQARLHYTAFSLIEVVLAVAIVSFSLLAIIGLLPVGLTSVRDSENDQAVGQIATQLRGQLQQISFVGANAGNISQLSGSNNFYTAEGLLITSSLTNLVPYYRATFAVNKAGVAGSAFNTANADTVVVTLAYPAPVYNQTTTFSLFATSQAGL